MESLSASLHGLLHPRRVAVVGASGDAGKFGGRVMQFLVKHGYGGEIIPVNPGAKEVMGLRAYARIEDAPGPVDVALLAVPAPHLPSTLAACGAAGAACCVIITADFAEAGADGAARERELVEIARRHRMRLLGPNCLGYINPHARLALTSSVALAMEPMPKGTIGLVSQSGSLMASMISHAQDIGTGFSACVTVGNQADLEICDFIEYFLGDPQTRAICAYIEGLKDGRRFLDLAARSRAAGKPLLAVKAGQSAAAAQVAQSHTASLAGSYEAWTAACAREAVCMLDDPESMIQCADFLIRFGVPRGDAIAIISPSGGTVAVTADRVAAAGLRLAELSPHTQSRLAKFIPPGRPLNPLDIGGLPREQALASALEVQSALAADPEVAVVFIVVATTPQLEPKVRAWGEAALACGKPTALLLTPGSLVDGARQALREIGCPYTNRMDDALRVIRTAIGYGRALRESRDRLLAPPYVDALACSSTSLPTGRLTESEAKSLARAVAIATAETIAAHDPEEAVRAAATLGYPVVLKAICRDLVHKSDIGAVMLGLRDAPAVAQAWTDIAHAVAVNVPKARFEGCTVQPMIAEGVEMFVGARWDPSFGALIAFGAGGVLVELLDDVCVALAPLTAARAAELLSGLRVWRLLRGARGRAACDIDAFVDAVVRVSWLAATLGERLAEFDINPLLVRPRGAIALDARATLARCPSERTP